MLIGRVVGKRKIFKKVDEGLNPVLAEMWGTTDRDVRWWWNMDNTLAVVVAAGVDRLLHKGICDWNGTYNDPGTVDELKTLKRTMWHYGTESEEWMSLLVFDRGIPADQEQRWLMAEAKFLLVKYFEGLWD